MEKYILINENDFQKARNKIREAKKDETGVIFSSNDDELNRKILEKEKVNILLLSLARRKDFIKQRNSGFNQVFAKLAKKNSVSIGINLDEILATKSLKEKSEILARVRQNIKLCNKNKLRMDFVSNENINKYNLRSLGLTLGMPTWMIGALA